MESDCLFTLSCVKAYTIGRTPFKTTMTGVINSITYVAYHLLVV